MSDPSVSPETYLEEQQSRAANASFANQAMQEEQARRIKEAKCEREQDEKDSIRERSVHQRLADAQADAERRIRATASRLGKELSEHEVNVERKRALVEAKLAMHLEADDAASNRELDEAETNAREKHERRRSVALAIQLAEEERLRRIAETEHDRLESAEEELTDRLKNQRDVSVKVEEERRRRLLENPLGSPFSTPSHKQDSLSDEALDAEMRRAASLLADSAAREEKVRRVHERIDEDKFVSATEASERKLNQQAARLAVDSEQRRRELEDEENTLEEQLSRRANIARARHLEEEERDARILASEKELDENEIEEDRSRKENQLKSMELSEAERQDQIEKRTLRK